MYIIMFV